MPVSMKLLNTNRSCVPRAPAVVRASVVLWGLVIFCVLWSCPVGVAAQATQSSPSERVAEQITNYRSLPDRTDELQQILNDGGDLDLVDRHYRITRSLIVDLKRVGASAITGDGRATLIMDGPGPALILQGTHQGTASPKTFQPGTWSQRMPVVEGFEILGADDSADGIELRGTVGAILRGVSIRWCQHATHLVERNRNVIISDCHFYENRGVGIFLDDVNLHQINVLGSHVSYNQGGGIVVRDGNVRNLQVSGCDLEANMPFDATPTETANVWIDVSGSQEDRSKSIAEISITGCTIQHSSNYSGDAETAVAPGGANIRLSGKESYPIDSVTISGNVISDTTINLDLLHVMDVTVSANTFFAPNPENIRVLHGNRVILQGNTFNPRQFVRPGLISFTDSSDCVIANSTLFQFSATQGAIRLSRCRGVSLSGLVMAECGSGVKLETCKDVVVTGCLFRGTKEGPDLSCDESCRGISLSGNLAETGVRVPEVALRR